MDTHEEVAAGLAKTSPVASNPQLEQVITEALVAGEEDPEAWLLYADWLQERGDPRGELITFQPPHPGIDRNLRASAILGEHNEYFLGLFGERRDLPLELTWRRGHIETARLYIGRELEDENWDQAMLTEALVALPSARFIRELTLGCASIHEAAIHQATQRALARNGPFPTLHTLRLITDGEEEMLSWTESGDLGHLTTTAPNLRTLHVQAGAVVVGDPGDLRLPALESLVIETCGMTVENLDALAGAPWPELRSLSLWFGSAAYGVDIAITSVRAVLDAAMPKLTHLGLVNNELTGEIVDLLATHPLLDQLETLDLSKGTLDDQGAARLVASAGKFGKLRGLDLRSNYIQGQAHAVRKALPRANLGEGYLDGQRDAEEWDGEVHRYADVGE